MSGFKGTPGPWHVNWSGTGRNGELAFDEVYVYAPECGVDDVAVAADIVDPVTGKPSDENARLIAAAPDLLAACMEVAQGYSTRGSEMARAAIAKVTGTC